MARATPSFIGLSPASQVSSFAKRRNVRRDTLHEVILRRELCRAGLRFRKNVESMPGNPDIVFESAKVIVFCDGDFWHDGGQNRPVARSHSMLASIRRLYYYFAAFGLSFSDGTCVGTPVASGVSYFQVLRREVMAFC